MGIFDAIPDNPTSAASRGIFDAIPDAQQPVADANPETWREYAEGILGQVGQGVMMNYADEISAGVGAALGAGDREELLKRFRGQEEKFKARHPKTAFGSEIGGALVPGGSTARFILRAPGWAARAARSALAAAPMGAVSATGRMEGDKTPGEYAEAAGEGAAVGAGFGAAGSALGSGLGAVAGPWATAAAQRLSDRGIRLTPGELVGGWAKRAEDTLTSIPLVNRLVRNRQAEGIEDFNRRVLQDTLDELNVGIGPQLRTRNTQLPAGMSSGRGAIDHVHQIVSRDYNRIAPQLRAHSADFAPDMIRIRVGLPAAVRADFDDAMTRRLITRTDPTGAMRGRDVQDAIQGLRNEAQQLRTSQASTAYHRELGEAIAQMRDLVEASVLRRSRPQVAQKFANINRAFARQVRAQKAAGSVAAENNGVAGAFTPAQYHNAVKVGDRSARKADFARGRALGQDISDDAKTVMTRKIADSGTPERGMLAGMIGGTALGMPAETLGSMAGLGGLYTTIGNRTFQRLATMSPRTRAALRRLIENATAGGAPVASRAYMGDE